MLNGNRYYKMVRVILVLWEIIEDLLEMFE